MSEFYYTKNSELPLFFERYVISFVVLAVVIAISLTFKGGWVKIKHCLSS